MTSKYEGDLVGRNLRIAVVASRFNETICKALADGARLRSASTIDRNRVDSRSAMAAGD